MGVPQFSSLLDTRIAIGLMQLWRVRLGGSKAGLYPSTMMKAELLFITRMKIDPVGMNDCPHGLWGLI